VAAAETVDDGGDVGFRVEVVQLGGLGYGVDDDGSPAALVGSEEQKVFPRQSDAAQLSLGEVVIWHV
jgi:hypothetical protein